MTDEFYFNHTITVPKDSDEEVRQYLHIPTGQIFYAYELEDICVPWFGLSEEFNPASFEEMPLECRTKDEYYSHAVEALHTSITGMRVITYPLNRATC